GTACANPSERCVSAGDRGLRLGVCLPMAHEVGIRNPGHHENPSAAEYGGISVKKQIVLAMAVSGALAGLVGVNEVLGYRYRYYQGFSPQYGFTGIAVALLGRNH